MLRSWLSNLSRHCSMMFRAKPRQRPKRRPPLRLEILEERLTPANEIWNGSSSQLWSNGMNWNSGVAPVNGDIVYFDTTQATIVNFTAMNDIAGLTVGGIVVNDQSAAGDFTLTGLALTLGGDLTHSLTVGVATNVNFAGITLGNSINVNNTAGQLNISAPINLTAFTLTELGTANTTITGVISGAGGQITQSGTGTSTLSGANTYTGATLLNSGTILVNNATALGTAAGTATVNAGATLALNGIVYGNAKPLTINGAGAGGAGAFASTGAVASSFTGPITLSGTSTITSTVAGVLFTISGAINTQSFTLTVNGNGNTTLSGVLSGAGATSLTMGASAASTLTLSAANTYSGATAINSGTVLVTNATGLGAATDSITVAANATLAFSGGIAIANAYPTTIFGNGVGGIGAINNVAGNNSFAGLITIGSNSTINSTVAATTLTLSGTINIQAFSLTVTGPGNVTMSGVVSGTAVSPANSLVMNGTGAATLTLSGAANNTYTGNTAINTGTVSVAKNAALGSGAGTAIVTAGATLAFTGGIAYAVAQPVTINGIGTAAAIGAISNTAGNNSFSGPITLASASNIGSTAGTLTLLGPAVGNTIIMGANALTIVGAGNVSIGNAVGNGIISGTAAVTQGGTGTLTLASNSAATFTGPVNFSAAGLISVTGVFTASTFNLTSGGTLEGTGTVGNVVQGATAAKLNPGTVGGTGTLTITSASNSTLNTGGVVTTYTADVNTNNNVSDQLANTNAASTLTITNAVLNVNTIGAGTAAAGTVYVIANSASSFGANTFAGKAAGSDFVNASGAVSRTYRIAYNVVGGLGFEITLTDVRATFLSFVQQPTNTLATQPIGGSSAAFGTGPAVQVLDQNGTPIKSMSFTINMTIGTNPGGGTLSGTTSVNTNNVVANSGVATFTNISINKTGNGYTLVATINATAISVTSTPFNIIAGSATHFLLTVGTTVTENLPFSLTVTALDAGNNLAPGYTGTVQFTSSDSTAILPANYQFTGADSGVHVFNNVVINRFGVQTITATDTIIASITGTLTLNVFEKTRFLVVAPDVGFAPEVKVYNAVTLALVFDFYAYDPSFTGGVRVAVGDVTGSGVPDIITVPGPGGNAEVKVFSGATGGLLRDFYAFDPSLTTGFYIASGNLSGGAVDDIVVGVDAGAASEVKAFDGTTTRTLFDFYAYGGFTGGVRVAVGDVTGAGHADIITGAGVGGFPEVKVFNGLTNAVMFDYFAYNASIPGGVFVAAGDVSGDGIDDIITGSGGGTSPQINVFNGPNGALFRSFSVYTPSFIDGVHVASIRSLTGGLDAAIAYSGGSPGSSGLIQQEPSGPFGTLGAAPTEVVDGLTLATLDNFFAYAPNYFGGVFVAGSI